RTSGKLRRTVRASQLPDRGSKRAWSATQGKARTMLSMTWQQVWARRLARHFLLKRAPYEGLVRTVGAVCGIQAQVMPAAELSVGIRVDGVRRNDVQAALWERRALVKTYGI